jgi:UDP-N-acetylmuramyl-tripeptide synthetase
MLMLHSSAEAIAWLQQRVTGTLHTDSRSVQAGDGFVAWPGVARDARHHVGAALAAGARAALVDAGGVDAFGFTDARIAALADLQQHAGTIAAACMGHPTQALQILAVTGTNGKTSTAWWLAQALSALPAPWTQRCGMVGTLGLGRVPVAGESVDATQLQATGMTTPDPIVLQRAFKGMVDQGLQACAIEASSIGLAEQRLVGTQIHTALFTNFTQDHLDYHGSMPAYWLAKRALFAWPGLRAAVINIDDSQGAALAKELSGSALDVWTVSTQHAARLMARDVVYRDHGVACVVQEGAASCALQTRLMGSYNVSNLLGVIAAMRSLGVPLEVAVQACTALLPVPGRMEVLGGVGQPLVVVDYAHTHDALAHVLTALRPVAQQRGGALWCVFGCGGDRDPGKRPLMGAVAEQHADHVVVTSDNPRSEKPEAIIAQILLGLSHSQGVEVQSDRALAIAETVAQAAAHDVVLLAGKGHESTQDVAGVKTPFADAAHAQAALAVWQAARTGGGA